MTNSTIDLRLSALREVMRREKLAAFIFPSTDPHAGEYVPDHWKGRAWISGFDGSAGIAVVTLTGAALWTDSRYFIQAEQQLKNSEFVLMRQKIAGTPSIVEWIDTEVNFHPEVYREKQLYTVGVDGPCMSPAERATIAATLQQRALNFRTNFDPLRELWHDRPALPTKPVFILPMEYAGESATSKLQRIRAKLRPTDELLVNSLDDIAWTLNLRGSDVECNPVFVSYLLITQSSATLFINPEKVPGEVRDYLHAIDIELAPYSAAPTEKVGLVASPIPSMKCVKNAVEREGFRQAMIRDGVAMVRFVKWLKESVKTETITELSASAKLASLRAEQEKFVGLSFETIAGYGAHGAIVHYAPTPESDATLEPRGLFLVDSGGQYLDGTTDITRTIPLGPLTSEEQHIYTLVLKGHIQIEMAVFPEGCSGTQIDCLARIALWREGLNYLHGTGHGVGAFLNVHEGPHQIRMEYRPAPLLAGMTITDEPGIYLEGRFGVRIENTLITEPFLETECGKFLRMRSLTLCPIDLEPIEIELLSTEERQWLNSYHAEVYNTLAPLLTPEEQEWLKHSTREI